MRFKQSIRSRLLFYTVSIFVAMAGCILILADYQLKKITNHSQNDLYDEKLDTIISILERKHERLLKTGLVRAYIEDFKNSVLSDLRRTYYKSSNQRVYPVIINTDRQIVMHPKIPKGDKSLAHTDYVNRMVKYKEGDYYFTYRTGEKKWCIFKDFKDWDWIVVYPVPLDIKYADVIVFRNVLIITMTIAVLLMTGVISVIITKITKPIVGLTNASTAIASGDLDHYIDTCGEDELGILAQSFTRMRDSIKKQICELATKNQELQSIVYVSSHDLKSPLVNIQGFDCELAGTCQQLETLLKDESISDELRQKIEPLINEDIPESLKFIKASSSRMAKLLDGLLLVSRVGSAEIKSQTINMDLLIADVRQNIEFQVKEKDVSVTIENLPDCTGDTNQINQVFSNLIGNAIKYLDPDKEGIIKITGRIEGDMSIYCVEDNGIGIHPDHQAKAFELFHRLNPDDPAGGEGLGLAIVSRAIGRNSGRIWVESEPDKGCKFFVALPTD